MNFGVSFVVDIFLANRTLSNGTLSCHLVNLKLGGYKILFKKYINEKDLSLIMERNHLEAFRDYLYFFKKSASVN